MVDLKRTSFEGTPRVVVCAAIRYRDGGKIVCGPRHGDCLNEIPTSDQDIAVVELGFVDQDREFLTREEAWVIADLMGQIRRPTTFERDFSNQRQLVHSDIHPLFSEQLY
jgi:hypothetical protein